MKENIPKMTCGGLAVGVLISTSCFGYFFFRDGKKFPAHRSSPHSTNFIPILKKITVNCCKLKLSNHTSEHIGVITRCISMFIENIIELTELVHPVEHTL